MIPGDAHYRVLEEFRLERKVNHQNHNHRLVGRVSECKRSNIRIPFAIGQL
jgi:hypothetical protein